MPPQPFQIVRSLRHIQSGLHVRSGMYGSQPHKWAAFPGDYNLFPRKRAFDEVGQALLRFGNGERAYLATMALGLTHIQTGPLPAEG